MINVIILFSKRLHLLFLLSLPFRDEISSGPIEHLHLMGPLVHYIEMSMHIEGHGDRPMKQTHPWIFGSPGLQPAAVIIKYLHATKLIVSDVDSTPIVNRNALRYAGQSNIRAHVPGRDR